jgi:signal transduction histidine kinase
MPRSAARHTLGSMTAFLQAKLDGFRDKFDAKSARHGLLYPWWIALVSTVIQLGCTIVALGQRDVLLPPAPLAAAFLIILSSHIGQWITKEWVPWWIMAAPVLIGTAVLLAAPHGVSRSADFAPVIVMALAAEVTATDGPKAGLITTAASVAVILTVSGPWSAIPVLEVILGFVVGAMLWQQMRALVAERTSHAGEQARATLAERQRIAHEIHDLVAHSLSVTLLHVTGARRALQQDADVPEAVAALTEAERIGRQAMTDIRRTVGMLTSETASTSALPGAADIGDLVAGFQAAGLKVDYSADDGLSSLPDAEGLGIYRVVQESLANVAKHAPTAPARVAIRMGEDLTSVSVRNRRPARSPTHDGLGSGIAGMKSRAEQMGGQLQAGAEGDDWVVELVIPARVTGLPTTDPYCPVKRVPT